LKQSASSPAPDAALIVVGAGPAGLMAALQAAWRGADVLLLDANPAPGRKLLVTGSGRCNLTNVGVAPERYISHSGSQAWLQEVLQRFGRAELLQTLEDINLLTFATPDGWYYPRSQSAQAVVEAFGAALEQAGVRLRMNARLKDLQVSQTGFHLRLEDGTHLHCPRLILTPGGKAYPALGSRGDCLPLLQALGHRLQPVYPALAPVLTDPRPLHKLQGLRFDVTATLWQGSNKLAHTFGNLIVTEWGLNGPAVMDLSHAISTRPGQALTLTLDLLPEQAGEDFERLLQRQQAQFTPLRVLLGTLLPPKAAPVLLERAGLPLNAAPASLSAAALQNLRQNMHNIALEVRGVRGFEYAQVSTGGVPLNEVDPHSLQSTLHNGLFLAGEVLDVIGPCGGYNLQFAFSSGAIAGQSAAA
jgi:predicted Rossmann fold flavoprotein